MAKDILKSRTPKTRGNDPLTRAFALGKVSTAKNGPKKLRKKRVGEDKNK